MSIFSERADVLFVSTSRPTSNVITVRLHAMNMCILNVIEDAVGNWCTSLLCGTKTCVCNCVDILYVWKFIGHVESGISWCVHLCAWAWSLGTCYVLGRPERHSIGCPSCIWRCPIEHSLGSVSMGTTLCEHWKNIDVVAWNTPQSACRVVRGVHWNMYTFPTTCSRHCVWQQMSLSLMCHKMFIVWLYITLMSCWMYP